MDIELLTIGTELLLGFTVDTNGAHIARALAAIGVRVVRRTSVADTPEAIRAGVAEALARTGAVLTTGGLGPTRDDVTKVVVAGLFGRPVEFAPALWEALLERYRTLGRPPSASNRTQAEVPRGAVVLPNRWGTAPGLWLEGTVDGRAGLVVMLPGVPHEMRKLLEHEVVPRLAARVEHAAGAGEQRVIRSRTVRTTAIPESTLAERVGDVEDALAPLTLAYLPGLEGVDLRVTAWHLPAAEADARLARAVALLEARAGAHAYGVDDDDLAAVVLQTARRRGVRLAVAESCTGGLVGGRLTAVAGSSDVVLGGVIAYANEVKEALLDVPAAVLAAHGAVSEATARAMAEGACRRVGAEAAVSVTGVAGPGGGSEAKPVGTVWFGIHADGETSAVRHVLPGNRFEIRARAAQMALYLLWRRLAAGRD
ncbi:MAG TPA: competence/damage-inducible protein A [Gemmatimonadales bacterium]|nr:competence/damage-inducible protein A [Gemmatimonadales bacterium]